MNFKALLMLALAGLGFVSPAVSQNISQILDSLKVELSNAKNDSLRSLILAELSYRYYAIPDSSYHYASKGLELAKAIHFEKGIAANQYSMGNYYSLVGDYVLTFEHILKALEWQEIHGTALEQARGYLILGMMGNNQLGFDYAINNFKKAYRLFEQAGNINDVVLVLNNLGVMYTIAGKYDSAMLYLNKGLQRSRQNKSTEFEAVILQSMGEMHLAKKNYPEAMRYTNLSIVKNYNFDKRTQAISYGNLASVFKEMKLPEKALESANTSLALATEIKDFYQLEKIASILHSIYLEKGNYLKAIHYLTVSMHARDSVYSLEKSKDFHRLVYEFGTKQKESQIKLLKQENSLKEVSQQLQKGRIIKLRYLLIGSGILLILLVVIIGLLMRHIKLKKFYTKTIELKVQRILSQNEEIKLLNEALETRVEERTRSIQEKNVKLEEYAFINAHRLRGPVATILGLLHLIEANLISEEELPILLTRVFDRVKELDQVVRDINKVLEE